MNTKKHTHIQYIVFIFIVLFSITGCSLKDNVVGAKGSQGPFTVAGTIQYPAMSLVKGSSKTFSPQIVGESSGATVTYSIEPALSEQGCSFSELTGRISIDTSADAMQKTYTVTATGTGNYQGSISTQITLHIAGKGIDGTLTYTTTSVRTGRSTTATPTWSGITDSNQTVRYSLGINAPAWLTIDSATGVVSIATSAPATVSTPYQVVVEGTGNYGGTISSAITIAIESKDVIDGVLSYPTINMATGVGGTFTPQITGATIPSQTVVYSVDGDPLPTGISLNQTTGTITITTSASNITKAFTIVARGTGDYAGQITSSVPIHLVNGATAKTIDGTLTFANFTIGRGISDSVLGSWSRVTDASQKVQYSIDAQGTDITIAVSTVSGGRIEVRVHVPASATTTVSPAKTYTIRAVGAQEYTGSVTSSITITVEQSENPEVVSYNNTKTSTGGAVLGPYIKDTGFADADVATISGLISGRSYVFTLGNKIMTKTANGTGSITIRKSEISSTDAAFGDKGTLRGGWLQAKYNNHEIVSYKSEIYSWKDLQAIRANLSGSYTLMNDITFPAPGSDGLPATGFEPLGHGNFPADPFTGTLDGNNKVIKKLAIIQATTTASAATKYMGLFGYIVGASPSTEVVKNLTLEDPVVTGGYYVGALAGAAKKATFTGIAITKSASASADVGVKSYGSSPTNVFNMTGLTMTGGILGAVVAGSVTVGSINQQGEKVTLIKSYNKVPVEGRGYGIGGLVGLMSTGKIVGYAETDVIYPGDYFTAHMGGLVGVISSSKTTVIGYFKGNIKAEDPSLTYMYQLGGLVGMTNGDATIYGFALGNIESPAKLSQVGGLVGRAGSGPLTLRGYHKGDLKVANLYVGGLVGFQEFDGRNNTNAVYQGYSRTKLYVVETPASFDPLNQNRSIQNFIGYLIGGVSPLAPNNDISSGSRLISSSTENIFFTSGTNPVPLSSSTDPTLAFIEAMEMTSLAPGGTIVSIINASTKTTSSPSFDGFAFGTDVGEWTYTPNKWPAINLGDEMPESAMSTQPIDP